MFKDNEITPGKVGIEAFLTPKVVIEQGFFLWEQGTWWSIFLLRWKRWYYNKFVNFNQWIEKRG